MTKLVEPALDPYECIKNKSNRNTTIHKSYQSIELKHFCDNSLHHLYRLNQRRNKMYAGTISNQYKYFKCLSSTDCFTYVCMKWMENRIISKYYNLLRKLQPLVNIVQ